MDRIYASFLTAQANEGFALAAGSDRLELLPIGPKPFSRFIARYGCRGLVCAAGAEPQIAEQFTIGFQFPCDYLRTANPFEIVTWLAPKDIFHPNIAVAGPFGAPVICPGIVRPGTVLVELLERCFDIITYRNLTMSARDTLNYEAGQWARRNQECLPIDPRPLRRRVLNLQIEAGVW